MGGGGFQTAKLRAHVRTKTPLPTSKPKPKPKPKLNSKPNPKPIPGSHIRILHNSLLPCQPEHRENKCNLNPPIVSTLLQTEALDPPQRWYRKPNVSPCALYIGTFQAVEHGRGGGLTTNPSTMCTIAPAMHPSNLCQPHTCKLTGPPSVHNVAVGLSKPLFVHLHRLRPQGPR